ncbi:MAG: WYL domain-containing protein [Ilumatobacteraceae bacterium]
MRRLLVMLPWLMERGSATLAEMCERFQVSERDLVSDLEQAAMCGLPPYLDEVVDLFIDEGVAYVGVPRFFTKPLRLTAPEGFSLITAGRAALALPGADPAGPLARAIDKLEAVLGTGGVVVDLAQPDAAEPIITAIDEQRRLTISYWSASTDEVTERTIAPRAVFADRGRWYVVADDERSGEERRFRIDRIIDLVAAEGIVDPRPVTVPSGDDWFDDAADAVTVTLSLEPAGRWVIERFPVRDVVDEPDRIVAVLSVASERWLRELLLRLGTGAEVLDPPQWRDLAGDAAREVLAARYTTES